MNVLRSIDELQLESPYRNAEKKSGEICSFFRMVGDYPISVMYYSAEIIIFHG